MGLIKMQIADGVCLNYLETDKFKTGYMSVNFIAPLDGATASLNALIPNILLRGSAKYPNMAEISKELDYLYASGMTSRCFKRGEMQIFGLCSSMIDRAYTLENEDLVSSVADMMEDILFNPITDGDAFDSAYTESEKSNLIDSINAKINNKAYYARMRCVKEMCKNERYGTDESGTVEDVAVITPASAYAQYRYALSSYPVEIFFVGRCDIQALADKFKDMFKSIQRTPVTIPETGIILRADKVQRVIEDMPVNQGKLTIGFRSGTYLTQPDYTAFMMFNEIFGGGVTSKLFMNVREKMSLCYYCSSVPDAAKGLLIVSSGIEVENREIAEKAIFDQLEAVKAGDFSDEEQENARLSLINSYRELSDSARALETWYLGRKLSGAAGDPDDVVTAISNITREEIIAVSGKVSLDTVYFLNGTLKGDGGEDD